MAEGEILSGDPTAARTLGSLVGRLEVEGVFGHEGDTLYQDACREMADALLQGRDCKAEITIKISLHALKGVVEVNGNVKTKLPETPRKRAMMFVAGGTHLSLRNPDQYDLPIRGVPMRETEIRSA